MKTFNKRMCNIEVNIRAVVIAALKYFPISISCRVFLFLFSFCRVFSGSWTHPMYLNVIILISSKNNCLRI